MQKLQSVVTFLPQAAYIALKATQPIESIFRPFLKNQLSLKQPRCLWKIKNLMLEPKA
jgi:hypothetical protein